MECLSCGIAEGFVNTSGAFLDRLLGNVSGPMLVLMGAIAAGWIVIQGFKLALGTANIIEFLQNLLFLAAGFGLVEAMTLGFVSEIYDNTLNMMFSAAAMAMGESAGSTPGSTVSLLIYTIERALVAPINMVGNMIENASVFDLFQVFLYGGLILFPLLIMLIFFIKHAVVGLFRITIVAILSPFIVGMSAFPFGRQMWKAAINATIASILVLFAVSAAFGLVIDVIGAPLRQMAMQAPNEIAADFGQLLGAIIFCWGGLFLVTESQSIAATLAGSALSAVSMDSISVRHNSKKSEKGNDGKDNTKDPKGEGKGEPGEKGGEGSKGEPGPKGSNNFGTDKSKM